MSTRALILGINRFRDPDAPTLSGCVNDARAMHAVVTDRCGASDRDVRVLLDAQATKAAVVDGLDWLIRGASAGDTLIFFASSHGTSVPDEDRDEADGDDEVLVVHDHDWARCILVDDEIARAVDRVPQGVTLVTMWDTCHSGTMNDDGARADGTRAFGRPQRAASLAPGVEHLGGRFFPGPHHASARGVSRAVRRSSITGAARKPGLSDHPSIATLTLAACDDDETAADARFQGQAAGAFTHCLLESLREAPAQATWSELYQRAKRKVREQGFEQTPQIHGPDSLKNAPAFARGRSGQTVSAPSPQGRAVDVTALDQRIGALESAGRWADAADALLQRAAAVPQAHEKVRTLEHLVSLYRVKLHDDRGAMRAAELILDAQPGHPGATEFLRAMYAATGDHAKLQSMQHRGVTAPAAPQGGILGALQTALGGAAAGIGAAAAGVGTAVTGVAGAIADANRNPQWMQQSPRPAAPTTGATTGAARPATRRCAYCGGDLATGATACGSCGAAVD